MAYQTSRAAIASQHHSAVPGTSRASTENVPWNVTRRGKCSVSARRSPGRRTYFDSDPVHHCLTRRFERKIEGGLSCAFKRQAAHAGTIGCPSVRQSIKDIAFRTITASRNADDIIYALAGVCEGDGIGLVMLGHRRVYNGTRPIPIIHGARRTNTPLLLCRD